MNRLVPVVIFALITAPVLAESTPLGRDSSSAAVLVPATRTFRFTYAATITGLAPAQPTRVWIPLAVTNAEQQVQLLPPHLPAAWQINEEPRYHNRIISFTAPADAAGTLALRLDYQITRRAAAAEPTPPDPVQAALFLQPDAKVPVGGKCMPLLKDQQLPGDPTLLAHVLYNLVDDSLQYRKNQPGWGTGDTDWVCDSRFGNCTDFHSLFISLARGEHLPAKFEIGFELPAARAAASHPGVVPGYHCWAWYLPTGGGWTPVDVALASQNPTRRDYYFGHLDENRVTFTTGRDLILAPPQAGPPLNYFIYPYAEVDGIPVRTEQINHSFSYADD